MPPAVAMERTEEQVETALYACETAPYPRLDLQDLVLPHWTISAVIEGSVRLDTGGYVYQVDPGDVMIHPPGVPFSETNPGGGLHLWLACEARWHDPHRENVLDRFPLPAVVSLRGQRFQEYQETFAQLEAAFKDGGKVGNRLRKTSCLLALICFLIDAWSEAGAPPRPPSLEVPTGRFAPIIEYLRRNLRSPITRAELADIAALHPTAFDRAFVRAVGETPMRLLESLRLTEARRRLETTDDTLDTIAHAVGMVDAAHLSRRFRARFGIAPGKWRDSVHRARTVYLPSPGSDTGAA